MLSSNRWSASGQLDVLQTTLTYGRPGACCDSERLVLQAADENRDESSSHSLQLKQVRVAYFKTPDVCPQCRHKRVGWVEY